jgi:phosphohistidine phosphatase
MQRLILFRHGEAEGRAASGKDIDRRHTARGREAARAMGERLASKAVRPDLVLVSQAARTQETWAAAQPGERQPETRIEPALYQADARTLLQLTQGQAAATVMLVAHNPGVQELALQLAEDAADQAFKARLELGFPAAAAAIIEFDAEGRPASGRLLLPSDGSAA